MPRRVTKVSGMTPLQALILDRMRERGWTPKQVEERGVTHATLHRYMNPVRLKQLPRQSVLDQLSAALELPVSTIRLAAMDSIEGAEQPWRRTSTHLTRKYELFIVVDKRDRTSMTDREMLEALAELGEAYSEESIEHELSMLSAQYDRAADTGPNRGAAVRDELDRQAELVSPPPEHDDPA